MKLYLSIVITFCTAVFAFTQTTTEEPTATELLRDAIAQLPSDPLTITGDIIVRRRRGIVVSELKFEMNLQWGRNPAIAKYVIRDSKNKNLETLTVTRPFRKEPKYKLNDEDVKEDYSKLYSAIQGTDMSWMDLSFSFLWWKDAKLDGKDKIRGQECYIVEVTAPKDKDQSKEQYSKAKLWIDKKMHVLLQAEGYGADGKIRRRLWVKSVKKIKDRWMIKDMEVQCYPVVHRTKIRIREVSVDTQP